MRKFLIAATMTLTFRHEHLTFSKVIASHHVVITDTDILSSTTPMGFRHEYKKNRVDVSLLSNYHTLYSEILLLITA